MKTLNFIYQETEIHFALRNEGDVMVNATEMAKMFNRRTKDFLKTDSVKKFIAFLKRAPNGAQIIEDKGRNGIYFNRLVALKFAAWLDIEFEVWVFSTIDNLIFGHYKEHWNAHKQQEAAKLDMKNLKKELLLKGTPELVADYFRAEERLMFAINEKVKALRNQLKLF